MIRRKGMSIWDKCGRIRVEITDELIELAKRRSSSHCAISDSIKQQIPGCKHVSTDLATIRFSYRGTRYLTLTPRAAQIFLVHFDRGEAVKGFVMHLKPHWIVSAKKKNHAPDNAELAASGLKIRVSRHQLQLTGHESSKTPEPPQTQRLTENGERNLDPNRSDGLAPPKRELVALLPKRRRRALISTPSSKGSIVLDVPAQSLRARARG
jgi:hypothetical protein